MTFPFLTIIIPTYNSEKTIYACIASILSQSFSDFEIILVDGLSLDNTLNIVKSLQSDKIKILSEKDEGIYDAMNKGIDIAKGKWLYFLGSDDKLHNNNVLEEVFKQITIINSDCLYGNAKIIGDTSWAKDGALYDGYFDLNKLLLKNICHQAIFYQREFVMNKIGYFNIHYKTCSDWDFNMRCWKNGSFFYFEKIIADFYGGGYSTNKRNDDVFSHDFNDNVFNYFGKQLIKNDIPNQEIKMPFTLKRILKFFRKKLNFLIL